MSGAAIAPRPGGTLPLAAQDRPTIKQWAEYVVLRALEAFLLMIPWEVGRSVGVGLGRLVYLLDKRERKERMRRNIQSAFPHFTPARVRATIIGSYCCLCQSAVDSIYFMRHAASGHAGRLLEDGWAELLERMPKGSGAVLVTGHFGCWEILGVGVAALGYSVLSVARPLKNQLVDRRLQRLRESTGQKVLPKKGSMRHAVEALKNGWQLGFLIDQDARRQGVFVDFFGRPASTHTSAARLAISAGVPLAFVYGQRTGYRNQFRVGVKEPIIPRKHADRDEEVLRITQRLTKDLEEVIRQWPEQWLWMHRRWKTYPGKYGAGTGSGRSKAPEQT